MPSRSVEGALRDILRHIDLARSLLGEMNAGQLAGDVRTLYAVIRCLEIISEASRRLPESLKDSHPSIPWRDVAGAGNIYRHQYEDVAPTQVWTTVSHALPALESVVRAELASSD